MPLPSAQLSSALVTRQTTETLGDRIHAVRSAPGLLLSQAEKLELINAVADSALASFIIVQVCTSRRYFIKYCFSVMRMLLLTCQRVDLVIMECCFNGGPVCE